MHRTNHRFWKYSYSLPDEVQNIVRKNFELLKTNPSQQSLHFKEVGKFWSVRVDMKNRAVAFKDGEDFIWIWIGTHD